MNKAVILDRDGTINEDYGYVHKIEDFKFIDGAIEGLQRLYENGYMLVIITNQSGIGRGYYTEKEYDILTNYMLNELKKNNIVVTRVYHCPHTKEDNCKCRKPKLELFYNAIEDLNIDMSKSYAIGDKERDLSICDYTKIEGILLSSKSNSKFITKKNLLESMHYILKNNF